MEGRFREIVRDDAIPQERSRRPVGREHTTWICRVEIGFESGPAGGIFFYRVVADNDHLRQIDPADSSEGARRDYDRLAGWWAARRTSRT